ncbi:MAG: hypothetical protein PHX87_00830 [Candidatus Peribacteraceae bacterium]|nr:hypothetical protein [Candidatus Peribacteraceae bacterium]
MKNGFTILRFIAAVMLLGALGHHPYAYYQLLRWVVCGVAAYSAYIAYESKNQVWTWIFGITAVLFNPLVPFYLERETWQLLAGAAAIVFVGSLFLFKFVQKK